MTSALPPKADSSRTSGHVRLVPIADSCTAAKEALFDHLVARASSIGVMVSLVEPAKERLEEIRYDAAVARLDFRSHGHRELENMRVAPPP